MRSIIKLLAVASTVALASCSKEYKPIKDHQPNTLRGFFTADFGNGDLFEADQQLATKTYHEQAGVTSLQITGIEHSYNKDPKTFRNITLSVGVYEGPKWYSLEYGNAAVLLKNYNNDAQIFNHKPFDPDSYISVESDNGGKLTGSFYFIGVRQVNNTTEEIYVSQGKFEAYE